VPAGTVSCTIKKRGSSCSENGIVVKEEAGTITYALGGQVHGCGGVGRREGGVETRREEYGASASTDGGRVGSSEGDVVLTSGNVQKGKETLAVLR
jgi:hypothetical protein